MVFVMKKTAKPSKDTESLDLFSVLGGSAMPRTSASANAAALKNSLEEAIAAHETLVKESLRQEFSDKEEKFDEKTLLEGSEVGELLPQIAQATNPRPLSEISIVDLSLRDARSIMDVAVYRLSKKGIRANETTRYELSNGFVEVRSGPLGMATIWDYDIVIMMVSWLTEAFNSYRAGRYEKPGRDFEPTVNELLRFCDKGRRGGMQIERLLSSLDRLKQTEIVYDRKIGNRRHVGNSSLIEGYRLIYEDNTKKLVALKITVPIWVYDELEKNVRPNILKMSPDYFQIESGVDRFIYKLARSAAGESHAAWSFELIYKHSGIKGCFRKFSFILRELIKRNDLPEYFLELSRCEKGEMLTMTKRAISDLSND